MMGAKSPLRVGIGGPAGAGKTALIGKLCKHLRDRFEIAVITGKSCTKEQARRRFRGRDLIFVESGEDQPALADLILYIVDASAGGDIPPIADPDLLILNKIDLARFAGADLGLMERDMRMRRDGRPFLFTTLKGNQGVDYIASFIAGKIGGREAFGQKGAA